MKITIEKHHVKIGILLAALLIFALTAFSLLKKWEARHNVIETDPEDEYNNEEQVYLNGNYYTPKDHLKTVLLIGVDKFSDSTVSGGYSNNMQADFLMLLILDENKEQYTALHLNRDTMAEIQMLGIRGEKAGSFIGQLALSHTYGSGSNDSCRNVVDAVENLLFGVNIDHYISFTMDAVAKINDSIGGVTLTLLDDFTSYGEGMTKGETVVLKGDMALNYVRARGTLTDKTNIARMERQRQYLDAFSRKFLEESNLDDDFFIDTLQTVSEYMVSDYTVNQLSRLYEQLESYENEGIVTPKGGSIVGEEFVEFYLNDDDLKSIVATLFYDPVEPADNA